jgi:hypothetical protein
MTEEEAQQLLRQVPMIGNYRIDISEGRASWEEHVNKLDAAVECLELDEPYSLSHMAPPPMSEPFGSVSKEAEREWHACNPDHPWARSCAVVEREDQWARDLLRGQSRLGSRPAEVDPYRESRNAAQEVLEWAHVAPQALGKDRRARIGTLLLHWDSGVTFELLRAVHKIDAREHATFIQELFGYLERYGAQNSWSYEVARTILIDWGIPHNNKNS